MNYRVVTINTIKAIIIGSIVLGGILLGIFVGGEKYTVSSKNCPVINDIPENIEFVECATCQWKWSYFTFYDNNNYKIEQLCPSRTSDVNLFKNDELVSRSDYSLFARTQTAYINDCHVNRIYRIDSTNTNAT